MILLNFIYKFYISNCLWDRIQTGSQKEDSSAESDKTPWRGSSRGGISLEASTGSVAGWRKIESCGFL